MGQAVGEEVHPVPLGPALASAWGESGALGSQLPWVGSLALSLSSLVAKTLGTFPHQHHVAFLVFSEILSEAGTVFLMFVIICKESSL